MVTNHIAVSKTVFNAGQTFLELQHRHKYTSFVSKCEMRTEPGFAVPHPILAASDSEMNPFHSHYPSPQPAPSNPLPPPLLRASPSSPPSTAVARPSPSNRRRSPSNPSPSLPAPPSSSPLTPPPTSHRGTRHATSRSGSTPLRHAAPSAQPSAAPSALPGSCESASCAASR